jgi:23S rRNA (cytidine1920-2'-O)/16S rRNA (cytidine1409-2'-O)-methyltransferase
LTRTTRLDLELVRRGLTSSRSEARRLIEAGLVTVKGLTVDKVSSMVTPDDPVAISEEGPAYVSRGGAKLDSALDALNVRVEGRRWMDAGASTGGFTDRLLQGGATAVVAVDVGYGQFDWRLRNDERVVLIERTNVRDLAGDDLPWTPDGVVADLSFISLRTVLPVLARIAAPTADHLLLVKPQFEVGRGETKNGVVRDPAGWARAIEGVVETARTLDLILAGVALAEPPGPSGNREFFVHLRRGAPDAGSEAIVAAIGRATR